MPTSNAEHVLASGLVPEWARYIAQDGCGDWWAYEALPYVADISTGPPDYFAIQIWEAPDATSFRYVMSDKRPNPDWKNSLHQVPGKEVAA